MILSMLIEDNNNIEMGCNYELVGVYVRDGRAQK